MLNTDPVDRVIRLAMGFALIAYAIPLGFAPTGWNWGGRIGVVSVLTVAFGFCPLYTLLGIATCPAKPVT